MIITKFSGESENNKCKNIRVCKDTSIIFNYIRIFSFINLSRLNHYQQDSSQLKDHGSVLLVWLTIRQLMTSVWPVLPVDRAVLLLLLLVLPPLLRYVGGA